MILGASVLNTCPKVPSVIIRIWIRELKFLAINPDPSYRCTVSFSWPQEDAMVAAKHFVSILGFALAIITGPAVPGAPITNQLTHPEIWDVHFAANGRDLAIRGAFAPGSIVLVNGAPQK